MHNTHISRLLLAAAFLGVTSLSETVNGEGARTVRVSGTITVRGTLPERTKIDVPDEVRDLHGAKVILDEDLLVGSNGQVENAFVYISKGAPEEIFDGSEKLVLKQTLGLYSPRVFGIRVGQTLTIENNDPLTHFVRAFPTKNRAFCMGQPAGHPPDEKTFFKPEAALEISCDLHKWMRATCFVMSHPFYAVTDADGTFTIENLPEGEYTLTVWHEVLKGDRRRFAVTGDENLTLDFTLAVPDNK